MKARGETSERHVLFRADGSTAIGVGHLTRCTTLAEELTSRGVNVHLAVRPGDGLPAWPLDRFPGPVHLLSEADTLPNDEGSRLTHADWLAVSQRSDANQVLDVINQELDSGLFDWVVVDHYGIDARWHRAVREGCNQILAIDDLADRQFDVDLVLDQNRDPEIAKNDYASNVSPGTPIMAGPRWALLREEFSSNREETSSDRYSPIRLLVVMGGSDPRGQTAKVIEALTDVPQPLEIVAVVGDPGQAAAVRACGDRVDHVLDVRVVEPNMASLMAGVDLAVSAAGSTVWELCCMGVPMALIVEELNQAAVADQAIRAGAALQPAGRAASGILETIDTMLNEPGRLESMSRAGQSLVDGDGTRRVCEAMLAE